jgi:pyruvate dehydrogenase (quinone)
MPPKVGMEYVNNLAESFAKGQPYAERIGLTLFRDKVNKVLKNIHTHSSFLILTEDKIKYLG